MELTARTPGCDAACSDAVALAEASRERLHESCPGAYRTPDGATHRCSCECHQAEFDPEAYGSVRLPVLDPEAADGPGEGDKTAKGAKKGAGGGGSCEHCGAPCNKRFAVGHDAKLKSELFRAAVERDPVAAAELWVRNWMRLVDKKRIPFDTMQEGSRIANREGQDLLVQRNADRSHRHRDGMV